MKRRISVILCFVILFTAALCGCNSQIILTLPEQLPLQILRLKLPETKFTLMTAHWEKYGLQNLTVFPSILLITTIFRLTLILNITVKTANLPLLKVLTFPHIPAILTGKRLKTAVLTLQ